MFLSTAEMITVAKIATLLLFVRSISAINYGSDMSEFNDIPRCPSGQLPQLDHYNKPLPCLPNSEDHAASCGHSHVCWYNGFNFFCCPMDAAAKAYRPPAPTQPPAPPPYEPPQTLPSCARNKLPLTDHYGKPLTCLPTLQDCPSGSSCWFSGVNYLCCPMEKAQSYHHKAADQPVPAYGGHHQPAPAPATYGGHHAPAPPASYHHQPAHSAPSYPKPINAPQASASYGHSSYGQPPAAPIDELAAVFPISYNPIKEIKPAPRQLIKYVYLPAPNPYEQPATGYGPPAPNHHHPAPKSNYSPPAPAHKPSYSAPAPAPYSAPSPPSYEHPKPISSYNPPSPPAYEHPKPAPSYNAPQPSYEQPKPAPSYSAPSPSPYEHGHHSSSHDSYPVYGDRKPGRDRNSYNGPTDYDKPKETVNYGDGADSYGSEPQPDQSSYNPPAAPQPSYESKEPSYEKPDTSPYSEPSSQSSYSGSSEQQPSYNSAPAPQKPYGPADSSPYSQSQPSQTIYSITRSEGGYGQASNGYGGRPQVVTVSPEDRQINNLLTHLRRGYPYNAQYYLPSNNYAQQQARSYQRWMTRRLRWYKRK